MAPFLGEGFLLTTPASRRLYVDYARSQPILDFHCHLPVQEIADNRRFRSLTEAWLGGDHYKWRAMRGSGVPERLVTGDATDREKFLAWASIVPSTVGNPLYHWSHLELRRYFGIDELLGPRTAGSIYDRCTEMLRGEEYRTRGLLQRMNVRVVCTTDDPADSLEHHARLRDDPSFPVTVVPAFRPDAALAVENPAAFNAWVDRLATTSGIRVTGWESFVAALDARHAAFHAMGCRASDHGLEEPYADDCTDAEAERILAGVRGGGAPDARSARAWKAAVMRAMGRMDAARGWVQQLHLGALRNINTRFLRAVGRDSGFDTIGDSSLARPLARFLDQLDTEGKLPKTIVYCLNPSDNAVLATIIGAFPQEGVKGKMQFGAAWWFNDQKHGIEDQLRMLADMGLLARFVGMLTDSRSFLSFPRHEYFRRILCEMLGKMMEAGEAPMEFDHIGGIVRDICGNNAADYFGIPAKGR